MGLSETQALVSDLANHGIRFDLQPTQMLPVFDPKTSPEGDTITVEDARAEVAKVEDAIHTSYRDYLKRIDGSIRERALAALRAAGVLLLALCLASSANAFPSFVGGNSPTTVQQPAGQWVLYNRPTWAGNVVFGPIWVFIPNQPRQLQQSPAPAFQPQLPAPTPSATPTVPPLQLPGQLPL